jgi:transcriptional regulator with XRE-family HTH domain
MHRGGDVSSTSHDYARDYGFADRALALRERAGLTQSDLAALLGVSNRAIQTWEAGDSYPGADRLRQLIALYLERGVFEPGREEEEAAILWASAREKASRRTTPFDPRWFASLRRPGGAVASAALPLPVPAAPPLPPSGHHWGEPPDAPPCLYGRAEELATLARWVREDRCRVVAVVGTGGVGKTALAVQLAHEVAPEFAAICWRSLRNAPMVDEWLAGTIGTLSAGQAVVPAGFDAHLGVLLDLLRARRMLLVLDNLETILEPEAPQVRYRAGYEGYGWSCGGWPRARTRAACC